MISLIFSIIFIIIFIFLCIIGGNYLLRSMMENIVKSKEHFVNPDLQNEIIKMDECKKIDESNFNHLNFQTTTNIPLSPNNYSNYIGSTYIDENANKDANQFDNKELCNGKYCLVKPKLLYDGIWEPDIKINSPYEHESWKLTNGNLSGGYYCSDKLIEVNKPIPKNFIDKSAVYDDKNSGYYYTYFNDTNNDIFDTEIQCFGSVFNAGITEDLKDYL
jgi:uncharacterized protein YneF (UPF0154 family)